jgi:oligopeptide/dipeptide ABC transporter ATP-binding protein
MSEVAVLEVSSLSVHFRSAGGGKTIHAVNDVSFSVGAGQVLGLVGESGSGKSTIARAILRLVAPTAGRIQVLGRNVAELDARAMRSLRSSMQIVFQDPWTSLNPRMTVGSLVEEPLLLHGMGNRAERRERVLRVLGRTGLNSNVLARYPAQLSGGQLQRVGIARALVTGPKLLILDEPTSSLDLSVRAGILALLSELRKEFALAMLFITHDLGTLRLIADSVMVLYLGAVMEAAPTEQLYTAPSHPYTQALLSATLSTDPAVRRRREELIGEIPSPLDLPKGCLFEGRCPLAIEACRTARPPAIAAGCENHRVACLRGEVARQRALDRKHSIQSLQGSK